MDKIRFATVWLAGCSGCHMSFLDLDELLFDLADAVEVVYSPVGSDIKTYPENVDICLVEGAVANEENLELALKVRRNTKFVVSFGDCAVLGNVPTLRNVLHGPDPVLRRCYVELSDYGGQIPNAPGIVPKLLDKVQPLHYYIDVDLYLPGCPPSADRIRDAIFPLLRGEKPVMEGREMLKFG